MQRRDNQGGRLLMRNLRTPTTTRRGLCFHLWYQYCTLAICFWKATRLVFGFTPRGSPQVVCTWWQLDYDRITFNYTSFSVLIFVLTLYSVISVCAGKAPYFWLRIHYFIIPGSAFRPSFWSALSYVYSLVFACIKKPSSCWVFCWWCIYSSKPVNKWRKCVSTKWCCSASVPAKTMRFSWDFPDVLTRIWRWISLTLDCDETIAWRCAAKLFLLVGIAICHALLLQSFTVEGSCS